ncbi:unnamed protein product [Ilex paraguariensis]|uniref:Pentatricopeptide repeat-containing protein n=1 Tax=Ilex paraguariensis TaxID=185542 RepID=A0ABC8QLX0_9AQUA
MAIGAIARSKTPLFASTLILKDLCRVPIIKEEFYSSPLLHFSQKNRIPVFHSFDFFRSGLCPRYYHDGRPRGPLWRGKKLIGKEALFVILGLKRFKDDEEKVENFIKNHVLRLLKMDMIAVLTELERQEEIFKVIQKQDWYKPDVYLFKDLIVALAKCKKMDYAMQMWENMRKEGLFPDYQTYAEVIRGFLRYGSPADAMNIYEDMKNSPEPPEELPFRILLKGLLPHPLLRNRVKQDFEEIFPDQHIYDPPEEIFGLR